MGFDEAVPKWRPGHREVPAKDASLKLVHVEGCGCGRPSSLVLVDGKVIDTRCIAAYLVPHEDYLPKWTTGELLEELKERGYATLGPDGRALADMARQLNATLPIEIVENGRPG